MKQLELTIYLKNKRKPLAKVICDSDTTIDNFVDSINDTITVVRFGEIVFAKEEFKYATIRQL